MTADDIWSRWLRVTRWGGSDAVATKGLEDLRRVRDRVLDALELRPDSVLLDVGAGDGLVAFGALERLSSEGRVTLVDISQALLDRAREIAERMGVLSRCRFVLASADRLEGLADESLDAATTRSVLIYVKDKASAFRELHRVLRPGGRISLFEPINRRDRQPSRPRGYFWGYDGSPIADLVDRVRSCYRDLQPDDDPMMDFDDRDLFSLCREAGFRQIVVKTEIAERPIEPRHWEAFLESSGNPLIPTIAEVLEEALSPVERSAFETHLRPLVEGGRGLWVSVDCYVTAVK